MGNYLDKDGLTRFKEKMLTEVDKRIASGGGGSSGDCPTKEELIEATSRVTDVEVNPEVAVLENLQTSVARVESNLNSKMDGDTVHLVETWSSGTQWYRKWSNGWIEQGGYLAGSGTDKTITFSVAFSNTNYTPCAVPHTDKNNSSGDWYHLILSKTTTTMVVRSYLQNIHWSACGY